MHILSENSSSLWEQIAIASYNSVRQEIHNMYTFILGLCSTLIAGLGAVSAFALSSNDLVFKIGIFLVVVPAATYLSGLLWTSLNVIMIRAATYLIELERQINMAIPTLRPPPLWEHYLRSKAGRLPTPRFWETTIVIVFMPSLMSIAYGTFMSPWSFVTKVSVAMAELALWGGCFFYCLNSVFRAWKASCDIVTTDAGFPGGCAV